MLLKPLVTVSGKKTLFKSSLHQRLVQDLPQEGVDWRRRLDSNCKSVYIDVDFVDFDIDNVERTSERMSRLAINSAEAAPMPQAPASQAQIEPASRCGAARTESFSSTDQESVVPMNLDEEPVIKVDLTDEDDDARAAPLAAATQANDRCAQEAAPEQSSNDTTTATAELMTEKDGRLPSPSSPTLSDGAASAAAREAAEQSSQAREAFFNQKLLGRPILHTYWADKSDFEDETQKAQFDDWIGQVQASTCTEWAIIIIEDGDFKAQLGAALFKSKLQTSTSSANVTSAGNLSSLGATPTSAISSSGPPSSSTQQSLLSRMKKGLSTIFQSDSNSDRWLTLINQSGRAMDSAKAQESYAIFLQKFRDLIMASFSKQIELFEEQLRVHREMRNEKSWNLMAYFSMQEELAFAFEFLTLFDEALVQYNLLDALFTEHLLSPSFNSSDEPLYGQLTSFGSWQGLCLDLTGDHSKQLRKRIIERRASLLEIRNYLFAKQCDLMLLQNQPWRVASSTLEFLNNCLLEHEHLRVQLVPGALTCWCFISALEVLQKCECYSCTSTMENYSLHTVDIWNSARRKLLELGQLTHLAPHGSAHKGQHEADLVSRLRAGLGPDPHGGLSYQDNAISPQARLCDALASKEQFAKHFIEMSELTLGTYKHIGRKRHALLVGKELAEFYMAQGLLRSAVPFFVDYERLLVQEQWTPLLADVQVRLARCSASMEPAARLATAPPTGAPDGGDGSAPATASDNVPPPLPHEQAV